MSVPGGDAWLVDPLALGDLSALARVFADPRLVTVVHAGDNDLAQLKRRHRFGFGSLFDTAVAARFLAARALGLDVLLEHYLGVRLPPSRQKDDWSARPLSAAQIAYALGDVRHLLDLKRQLAEELARAGRLAWVEEECAALAALPVAERVPDPHAYAALKGARELSPRGLAALRELVALRAQLAREGDRPPFKIVSDETLVRLAQVRPRDRAALAAVPGCTARVIERWGAPFLEALSRADALGETELPALPRSSSRPALPPVVRRRIEALRRWRGAAADRVGLDPGLLLPNRLIGAIAESGPRDRDELLRVDGVRRWRAELIGPEILVAIHAA